MITNHHNFETTTDFQYNKQFIKSNNIEDIFNVISKLSINKKTIFKQSNE